MKNQNSKFRAYFLGKLADNEAAAIELNIISDSSLEAKMHSAESELMEDYLDEMLAPDEKELFDKNFLVTKERQIRVDFLKQLKKHARSAHQKKPRNSASNENAGLFNSLKNLFSLKLNPVPILIAASLLILAAGFIWIIFFNQAGQSDFAQMEKAINEINQKDFNNASAYQNFSNLRLIPGNLRSPGNKNSLFENNLTDEVFLRLMLPIGTGSDKSYTAKIKRDGKTVLTLNEIRTYENKAGREIRLLLPENVLNKGEYQIELNEQESAVENSIIVYLFSIE